MTGVLIQLAIAEKKPDEVLKWYELVASRNGMSIWLPCERITTAGRGAWRCWTAYKVAGGQLSTRSSVGHFCRGLSYVHYLLLHCRRVTNTRIVREPPRRTLKGKETSRYSTRASD